MAKAGPGAPLRRDTPTSAARVGRSRSRIDLNRAKVRVAVDLSGEGVEAIRQEEAARGQLAEDALREFEQQMGLDDGRFPGRGTAGRPATRAGSPRSCVPGPGSGPAEKALNERPGRMRPRPGFLEDRGSPGEHTWPNGSNSATRRACIDLPLAFRTVPNESRHQCDQRHIDGDIAWPINGSSPATTRYNSMAAGQPKPAFYVALAVVVLGLIGFAYLPQRHRRAQAGQPQERRQGQPGGRRRARSSPRTWAARAAGRVDRLGQPDDRQGVQVQAGREAAAGQGRPPPTSRWQDQQHRPVRAQRLGRLGADHPGQQRLQGRQGVEDARRQGVQGRARADRRSGRDARRLRRRRRPHRLGDARHGAAVPRGLRRCARQPATAGSCRAIYQQVDWSNGGDGIVVRENIKTVADLRGKTIVLAQNSPSHYFVLNMLVDGGVQPSRGRDVSSPRTPSRRRPRSTPRRDLAGCVSLGARHLQPGEGQGQPHAGRPPGRPTS